MGCALLRLGHDAEGEAVAYGVERVVRGIVDHDEFYVIDQLRRERVEAADGQVARCRCGEG